MGFKGTLAKFYSNGKTNSGVTHGNCLYMIVADENIVYIINL